jgi:hypothetical protein
MQCNPNSTTSIVGPTQQVLNEAVAQINKDRANIIHKLESTNLKMSSLIRDTPSSSVEIEALELETRNLLSHLEALLSSHRSDIDRFPAHVVMNLMISAGHDRQKAEDWATRNLETVESGYQSWQHQRSNITVVFQKGKEKGWVEVRNTLIRIFGKEQIMATKTWG